MLSGGCVLIDHTSGYVSINHHVDINTNETVQAKISFKREDKSHGLVIKGYHTDNGIFNASDFMEDMLNKQKNVRFMGAGASHQHGGEERTTKIVVTMASTMLMHAALRCPEKKIPTDLLPLVIDDVWVYNCIPDMQSGLSAIEI